MQKLIKEVLDYMVFYGWLEAETSTWLQLKENEEELKKRILEIYHESHQDYGAQKLRNV